MQFYKNISGIPVHIKHPDYERNFLRMSHKIRKKQNPPVLECGNASVVFQIAYTDELYNHLVLWWESEYDSLGEDFNVELYRDTEAMLIEIRFFCEDKSFYKPKKRHSDSILDDIDTIVLDKVNLLPECFTEIVELCYISDFDYLEPAEYEDE